MKTDFNFRILPLAALSLLLAVPAVRGADAAREVQVQPVQVQPVQVQPVQVQPVQVQPVQVQEQKSVQGKALDTLRLSRDFSKLIQSSGYQEANVKYQAAIANSRSDAQKATVNLSYANSLAQIARQSKDLNMLETADEHYRFAIEKGSNQERLAAINNYAKTTLELGDSRKAVELFEQGYAKAKELKNPAAQAKYLYNYGNALSQQGRIKDAVDVYLASYLAYPREQEAALASLDPISVAKDIKAANILLKEMIDNGHLAAADKALRQFLSNAGMKSSRDFIVIIESLYDYLLAARVDEATFSKKWASTLKSSALGMDDWPRNFMNFVWISYDQLPVIISSSRIRREFAQWTGSEWDARQSAELLHAPSRYLTGVGEIYAGEGRLEQALARYLIGWGLDTSNLRAGQFAANLLYEYRSELDPDKELLDRFVGRLFRGKGEAYLGEDWPAIFRFHSILASIYVRDKVWGSSGNVRSAIFQLENALRARSRIQDPEEKGVAVPGLYAMLGQAYNGVNDKKRAFDSYLTAAREAMRLSDKQLAVSYLQDASDLAYNPSLDQREQLKQLRRRAG